MNASARTRILGLVLIAPLLMGANQGGDLTISVSGLEHTKGKLLACIFKDKKGFPTCQKSSTAIRKTVPITGTSMKVTFRDVPPGTYAVSVQHDEDANGKLKTNFIGMPKEGVGISNNPGGIPRWSKSQVTISGDKAIAITMRYL